jgi:hypothetical protein
VTTYRIPVGTSTDARAGVSLDGASVTVCAESARPITDRDATRRWPEARGHSYAEKQALYKLACAVPLASLTSHAKVVLGYLLFDEYYEDSGHCSASEPLIAAAVGLKKRTVARCIAELQARGFIRARRRFSCSNRYEFNWDLVRKKSHEPAESIDPRQPEEPRRGSLPADSRERLEQHVNRVQWVLGVDAAWNGAIREGTVRERFREQEEALDAVLADVRLYCKDAHGGEVAHFVDSVRSKYVAKKGRREVFGSRLLAKLSNPQLGKELEKRPTRYALEAVLERVTDAEEKFLPASPSAILRMVKEEDAKFESLANGVLRLKEIVSRGAVEPNHEVPGNVVPFPAKEAAS